VKMILVALSSQSEDGSLIVIAPFVNRRTVRRLTCVLSPGLFDCCTVNKQMNLRVDSVCIKAFTE
jgi:hypothetical protein